MKILIFGVALMIISEAVLATEYVIRTMDDVKNANKYTDIRVKDLFVPAGTTFKLSGLKPGTVVTFLGRTTFGYEEWAGPLIRIEGKEILVTGGSDHVIDGEGQRWWDGLGANGGKTKPKFFQARLTDSFIHNLIVKNTPVHAFSINNCQNLTVSGVLMDDSAGDSLGGHNTDGFDVGDSTGITIKDCIVKNQDDCLAINSGVNVVFKNNVCSGGHGISIGSVGGRKNNVVDHVLIQNNVVSDSDNGIRVKTVSGAVGSVNDITFENIVLKNIRKVGITIQGNYINGGPRGEPTGGVPISNLKIKNVIGQVDPKGTNVLVWVANASNWRWDASISGGKKIKPCQGFPAGVPNKCT